MAETEKLQRLNRELSILNAIAQALNREVDLQQALHTTLALVADLCGLQTGWIWLLNEATGDAYLAVAQNLPPTLVDAPHIMNGSTYCYCLDTYKKGDLEGAANVNSVTCTRLQNLGNSGLQHHTSIPLYAHGKSLGMLNVATPDWSELSDDELRMLNTIGDMLSMAIERARLFQRSAQFGAAEERSRLAREIHDTLAQGLTAITLQLETADALLETGNVERAHPLVQQALAMTRVNLEEARRSVLDLRAAPLEGSSLSEALEILARDYALRWNLQLQFEADAIPSLTSRIENGLYRIAQEALTNVVRHAHAQTVRVQLQSAEDEVILTIADDGIGFNPKKIAPGRYGVIGMNERVKLLGGELHVSSSPGDGTEIEVLIPTDI